MKTVISIVLNNFLNDSRVLKEAISLKNNNYNVKVVALHEEGLLEEEIIQEVPVHRVNLTSRDWSKNKLIQILKYIEFVFKVVGKYKEADILHCNDLNTLPVGYIVKKFFNKKVKVVYDAHEHETEKNGLHGFEQKVAKRLEKFLIKCTDSVITVSDAIANDYEVMYNIEKPTLVFNTPYYQKIEKSTYFQDKFNLANDSVVFLYQGKLSKGRGVEMLIETFKEIDEENKVLVIMGYGVLVDFIKEQIKSSKNIHYHEAVSPIDLVSYTCCANFGISMIEDTCLSYRYCLPNKMFEYIMAEIPVIVSNLVEMKKVVQNNQIGVVAEHNTKESLKKAIIETENLSFSSILKNLKKVKEIYNWEQQEKKLVELYNQL